MAVIASCLKTTCTSFRCPLRVRGIACALMVALLASCTKDGGAPKGSPTGRPNVVFVVIDTLRADAMSVYGNPWPTSPELDEIARSGVRFRRAVSQSAWTRPSFASFLTSHIPRESGISQERKHVLPDNMTTLAETLHDAGYTTLGVTANPNVNSTFKFDQGFDAYVNAGVRFGWMGQEASPSDKLYGQAPLRPAPEVFDDALALLDKYQKPAKPVYLQLVVMDVHEHLAKLLAKFAAQEFKQHPDRHYFAALRYVSVELQRFLDKLRQRPGFENTMLVIISDHGEGLRSHPHVQNAFVHGYVVYESQTLVPWIMAEWGSANLLPSGVVVEQPVRLLDLMPTMLDLLGIKGPANMEGLSVRAALTGGEVPLPKRFVVETKFRNAHAIGVYGDKYMYVENRKPLPGTAPVELQRMGAIQDGAATNVAGLHADVVSDLKRHLNAWEKEHPWAPPTMLGQELKQEELDQLRALGYAE